MKILYYLSLVFQVVQRLPFAGRGLDILSTLWVSLLRGFSGSFTAGGIKDCKRPEKVLKLYEFEACPFCRKVREVLTVLDIDVMVYPCPRETMKAYGVCEKSRFRPEVTRQGGQLAFPFLVDENTGVKMNESDKICAYLWATYGEKAKAPLSLRLGQCLNRTPLFFIPSLCRPLMEHGMLRAPSKPAEKPLELWGCEASPFCKIVREALCVLELPYLQHNVAHGSAEKRIEFRVRFGEKLSAARRAAGSTVVQVPLLVDPNTGAELLESSDIVSYLYRTYQDGPPSKETWLDLSTAGKKPGQFGVGDKLNARKED